MLYIIYGTEDYSIRQALNDIKKTAGDGFSDGLGITMLEGAKTQFNDFKITCETLPFLSDKRVVVTEGLLERFETKFSRGQNKKTGASDKSKEIEQFSGCINNMPSSTVLVLIDGDINKQNPLLKQIAGKAEIREYLSLKRKDLTAWIQKRITESGRQISPIALDLMAKLVGNDLWAMANEIDKLVLYCAGRTIQEKDVKVIVSHAQETSVFTLVDAIFEGRTSFAEELLHQLLNNGAAPTYLLTMLSRQIRLALLAKEMISQHDTKNEIQTKLRLADFSLQKTMEQAGKYSIEQIKRFYEKLLETDIAIKTGKYGDELALNILVIELGQT